MSSVRVAEGRKSIAKNIKLLVSSLNQSRRESAVQAVSVAHDLEAGINLPFLPIERWFSSGLLVGKCEEYKMSRWEGGHETVAKGWLKPTKMRWGTKISRASCWEWGKTLEEKMFINDSMHFGVRMGGWMLILKKRSNS